MAKAHSGENGEKKHKTVTFSQTNLVFVIETHDKKKDSPSYSS